MEAFALGATAVVLGGCVLVLAALLALRLSLGRKARRHQQRRTPVWTQVLSYAAEEPGEHGSGGSDAFVALAGLPRSERALVIDDVFALVRKVRGGTRERLQRLLHAWGSVNEALAWSRSRSVVRRCRGTYRLGVLADAAGLDPLTQRLTDRAFPVRRLAVQALGQLGDPVAVGPVLAATVREPELRRDLLAALDRIGHPAVPALRGVLQDDERGSDRTAAWYAAEALGLAGAVEAAEDLLRVRATAGETLAIACADALGVLGVPTAVAGLAEGVRSGSARHRRHHAVALGRIGGQDAVPVLAAALHDTDPSVARAAAEALGRCGPLGETALAGAGTPMAREALALRDLDAAS